MRLQPEVWHVKESDVAVARNKLTELADETGLSFDDLVKLWSTETADQLESAVAALAAGNLPEAARLVHGAAGATGMCGVVALADQLKAVELLAVAGRGSDAQEALTRARTRFERVSGLLSKSAEP
jgi:HPt (histidine-containing phosphotransfer) domain-containing protein